MSQNKIPEEQAEEQLEDQTEEQLEDQTEEQATWLYPGRADTFFDPLLTSLVILTKFYGQPASQETLKAGLPLDDDRLSLALFTRAAKRAGLSSRVLRRKLSDVSNLITPCIVLLKNRNACVLTDIDHEENTARVILPESSEAQGFEAEDGGDAVIDISLEQLQAEYNNHIVVAKPEFKFDERAERRLKLEGEHWFWGTLSLSKGIYRDVLIASVLINLFALVMPMFTRNVYDRVVPNNAIDTMWALAIGAFIVFSFDAILKILRSHFIDLAGKKSDLLLSSELFSRVLGMRLEGQPASVGSFSRSVQDFETIRDFITSVSISALVDFPFVIIFLIVIGLLAGPLVWVPIAGIVILIITSIVLQPVIKSTIEKSGRASTQKNAMLVESLAGIESVKTTGAEGQLQAKWESAVSHIADWNMKGRYYSNLAGSIGAYVTQIVNIALLISGVYLIMAGELSMGGLIAAVMLSSRAIAPINRIVNLATRANATRSAYATVKGIMEMEVERPEQKTYIYRPQSSGEVQFDHVDFNYPDASYKALSDVSFHLQPRQKLGIVGRIGSGKSTIARLILGLYQQTEGSIEVDGIDINQINPSDLRRQIGAVNQDQVLFYGSIRENIVMGVPHVEDQVIERAANLAGVMDFASHHPEGMDLNVGERGRALSGGQRQSVILARALLLDPPLLILDEPTSNMDNSTEAKFMQRLQSIIENKSLIIVTHKPVLLKMVDQMMVLDSGRVVAYGEKEDVMQQLSSNSIQTSKPVHNKSEGES